MISRRSLLRLSSVSAAAAWSRSSKAIHLDKGLLGQATLTPNVGQGSSMQLRILYIGGGKSAQDNAEPATIVDGTGFDTGTSNIRFQFWEHLAAHQVIRKAVEAEKKGYDAVVIGCFYDPGVWEARELVRIPVVGVCEASLHVASMLTAGKFSVLVNARKNIPKMAAVAAQYGFESRIASWRVVGADPRVVGDVRAGDAIVKETKRAIEEDQAECVVLGSTSLSGQARKPQFGVPVLDPALMGLKVAELRALLWKRFGLSHSRIGGYAPPPTEELDAIYKKVYGTS